MENLERMAFIGWTEGISHARDVIMSPMANWIIMRRAAYGGNIDTILCLLEINMRLLRQCHPKIHHIRARARYFCSPDEILRWGAESGQVKVMLLASSLGAHSYPLAMLSAVNARTFAILIRIKEAHDRDCQCQIDHKDYLLDALWEIAKDGNLSMVKCIYKYTSDVIRRGDIAPAFDGAAECGNTKVMRFLWEVAPNAISLLGARESAEANGKKRAVALIDKLLKKACKTNKSF